MKRSVLGLAAALACAMTTACSGSGDSTAQSKETLTVQGNVPSAARRLDNARAVAFAESGHVYWAYLDAQGDFSLKLPVGQSYRVVIANQLDASYQRAVGHVVIADPTDGTSSEWIGANEAGTVDLGTLGTAPASQDPSVTHVQCGCTSGGSDDHSDDYDTHSDDDSDKSGGDTDSDKSSGSDDDKSGSGGSDNDDDDKAGSGSGSGSGGDSTCNVCKDHQPKNDDCKDKTLYPSNEPGDKCKDKHKSQHDSGSGSGSGAGDQPCPYADGGSGSGSGSGTSSGSDSSGSGSGGGDSYGGSGGSGSGDTGGSSSGADKPSGSGCSTTSECTSTCSCVASTCAPKYQP